MNFEQLLEYLDLEEANQFEYFETMADLMESEDEIEQEAMYQLFSGANAETMAGLLEDYFEDILEGLPENAGEIYSLLHQIQLCLVGLASAIEDESDLRRFTDEMYRFQNWYSHESEVELTPDGGGERLYHSVRDAITAARLERLGGERYQYDFENALDYPIDSYTMSVADLVAAENDDMNDGRIVFTPGEEDE